MQRKITYLKLIQPLLQYNSIILFYIFILSIIELDLPQLELIKPDYLTSQRINLNEEIKMSFNYPIFDPDSLFYGGAIIYDYNVVAILRFYYKSITIKIWDSFQELQDLSQIGFRASVYDPHFFMPSTTSILINLNPTPKNCKLSVNPAYGLSFNTFFYIEVTQCADNDKPFTYKFSYYMSPNQYNNDVYQARSLNQILLQDFQIENKIQTILPYPSQDQQYSQPFLMLMVSVSDSAGGLTNLTSNVVIGINQKDLQNQLKMAELIKKKQQIDDQFKLLQSISQNRLLTEFANQIDRLNEIYATMDSLSIANQISQLNLLAMGVKEVSFASVSDNTEDIELEKQKLSMLKTNILTKLRYFQQQDVSVATKSQITKSIALMMNDEEIIQNTSTEAISNYLNDANQTLISSINDIQQIQKDIDNEYVDFRLFQKKESHQNNIMRAAGQLDGLLSANQQQYDQIATTDNAAENITNLQIMQQNNNQFLLIQESIKSGLILTDDPNAPPKIYTGNSFSLKSQIVTQSKLIENLGGINPFITEQTIKISADNSSNTTTINSIFMY